MPGQEIEDLRVSEPSIINGRSEVKIMKVVRENESPSAKNFIGLFLIFSKCS
jgi:hypothetical protein